MNNWKERKKSIYQLWGLGMLMILLLASVAFIQAKQVDRLKSQNGILNLKEWEDSGSRPMFLYGEWEFYWNKLLYKDDFKTVRKPDTMAMIPSVWNNYKILGKSLPGKGFATYRLHVVNAKPGQKIAFRMSPVATAYRMYIDDQLVAKNGITGISVKSSKGEYRVQVFHFTPQHAEFDIIMQISNYTYARGGLWYAPEIGRSKDILAKDKSITMRDAFLIGCFMLIMLDSFFIFLIRRKEKSRIYLGIMCVGAIGRTIVYSSYIITNFKILSDLNILVRVEYIGLSWMVLVFMLLTNSQFPEIIHNKARKFIVGYLLLYTTIVVILPVYYFTQFIYMMEFVCMLAGLYTTIKIALVAIQGNKDAILISVAGTIYMSCGTHDILIHNNIMTGGSIEYQPIGFLIFLACESIVLAKKHVRALEENERAIIQIEAMAKRERETELKFLKSQIRPHFIHNALNAIISLSRTDPNRSRNLLVEFSRYLRNSFDFDNLDNLVPLKHEIQFVKSYLAIEEARFGERLLVKYEIEETSILIPPLILQPLAENAVVHGIHDNVGVVEILIYVKVADDKIKIGVRDNGKGIPEEKIKELQENKSQGRGVGLRNINQRLQKIYGTSLIIENLNEKGCDIFMCLPYLRGEVSFHEDNVN